MKPLLERFTSKREVELQAEAEAEFRAEREATLAELQAAESDYETEVTRLNEVYEDAVKKHQTAKAAADEAYQDVISADAARDRAANEMNRRIDAARNELDELTPPILAAAIERLSELAQQARELPIRTPSDENDTDAAQRNAAIAERLRWIRDEGRPALLALRYQSIKNLESEIEKIMPRIPALK